MSVESVRAESLACDCGCGQVFPLYSGVLRYGAENLVAFRAAHLIHDSGPHLWLLLGSGPWFDGDGGSWVTLHSWLAESEIIARVEDPDHSPFTDQHVYGEQRLTRDQVLSKQGGLEWAVERREDFIRGHPPSAAFLLQGHRA